MSIWKIRLPNALLVAFLFFSTWSTPLAAQQPAVVEVSAGAVAFTEETEPFVGAAARFYVLPRVSLGPEVIYISGNEHSHVMVTGNLVFDFLGPRGGQPRLVTPFVVVGGGIFQTRERFSVGNYNYTEGAFTAGGGVRALLGNRVTVGADVRIGWELHVRVGGTIGVRLGK